MHGEAQAHDARNAKQSAKTPALPWMRVPFTIRQGSGEPVSDVKGLNPQLAAALKNSEMENAIERFLHAVTC